MIAASLAAEIDAPSLQMYALAEDHRAKFLHLLGSTATRDQLEEEKRHFSIALLDLARRAKIGRESLDKAIENLMDHDSTRSHGNMATDHVIHHEGDDEAAKSMPWYMIVILVGFVVTFLLWCFRELGRNRKPNAFHNMSTPGLVMRQGHHGSDFVVGNPVPGQEASVVEAKPKGDVKISVNRF